MPIALEYTVGLYIFPVDGGQKSYLQKQNLLLQWVDVDACRVFALGFPWLWIRFGFLIHQFIKKTLFLKKKHFF